MEMEEVTISAPRFSVERGWPKLSASVIADGDRYDIFYRVSRGPLAEGAETFLAAGLMPAMKLGAALRIDAAVSTHFLQRVRRIQEILSSWFQDLHMVPVHVAEEVAAPPATAAAGVGCFFSGGVDSFYTVLKHRAQITNLIFVHGFDVALDNVHVRSVAAAGVQKGAAELGIPLIEVETNLRDLLDAFTTQWASRAAGPAMASVALLCSPSLHEVYIARGVPYTALMFSGLHPYVMQLWGTPQLEIVDDGGEAERHEKVARVAQSETALRYLRVCWQHLSDEYNCGQCVKCVHTMIDLHLAGALSKCYTLPPRLDLSLIRGLELKSLSDHAYFEEAQAMAEKKGGEDELVQALRACLGATTTPTPDQANQHAVRALRTRVSNLEADLARTKRRAARLERQRETVTASRSWRLTAPLRRAADLGRRASEEVRSWRR